MIIVETCPKCGHDLMNEVIYTNPPIPKKRCPVCGWSWEGTPKFDEVVRVPFVEPVIFGQNDSCVQCPNNIKNGGSGIFLGQQVTY